MIAAKDALWIVIRREGAGGLAVRAMPPSAAAIAVRGKKGKAGGRWRVQSVEGVFDVSLEIMNDCACRIKTSLTPTTDLLIPFWPRDLYPLDNQDDPTRVLGNVEAAQRGLNAGLCLLPYR